MKQKTYSPYNTYSTNETIIGEWQGSILYRRIFEGNLTGETTNYFYDDINNLDSSIVKIVNFSGYLDNNLTDGSHIFNALPNAWLNATWFPTQYRIRVYSYDKTWFPLNSSYYLVVEYTKS